MHYINISFTWTQYTITLKTFNKFGIFIIKTFFFRFDIFSQSKLALIKMCVKCCKQLLNFRLYGSISGLLQYSYAFFRESYADLLNNFNRNNTVRFQRLKLFKNKISAKMPLKFEPYNTVEIVFIEI